MGLLVLAIIAVIIAVVVGLLVFTGIASGAAQGDIMATIVVRRLYFYAAAFIGLQMLAVGARDLLSVLLEQLLAPALPGPPEQSIFRLSASVALLLVGLPLWAIHWYVAQRSIRRPEEQHAKLRRLYGYLVLVVAMLITLFALRGLLDVLFGGVAFGQTVDQALAAFSALVVNVPIWVYHWRVFSADRDLVEPAGGNATLRRWYLFIVQAVSLGMVYFGAIDLIHQLLQWTLAPAIGSPSGIGLALATLTSGLAVWLPHHLWARHLLRAPTPLRADETNSTLRQVYIALVITVTAIAALGGLVTLLYAVLLAAFGGAAWSTVIRDHTQALSVVLVSAPVWNYHRQQLAHEARLSAVAARSETAQRVIGYLMAAVGLGALFFGLGGLAGTLLRMWLAPIALGTGWREPLSLYLALSLVAVPVYGYTAYIMEGWVRRALAEERTLARRIYLYAALLFGIVATISAAVVLLRLVLGAALGSAEPDLLAAIGTSAGYTVVGAAIGIYYALLVRRAGAARGDFGSGLTIAIVADEPLRPALITALERELPGAMLHAANIDQPEGVLENLGVADILLVPLAAVFEGPLSEAVRAFKGRRLLLASAVPGYDLIGIQRNADAIAREAARALRTTASAPPRVVPPPVQKLPQGAA